MKASGKKQWFIPGCSTGDSESFETLSILNTGEVDAAVHMTLYFEKREPIEDIVIVVKARSSRHLEMRKPKQLGGVKIPKGLNYGAELKSDVPIVVQFVSRQGNPPSFGLMTLLPYSE